MSDKPRKVPIDNLVKQKLVFLQSMKIMLYEV